MFWHKCRKAWLKGTVPRDFLPLVILFKQLLLAPVDKPSNDFSFFRIFAEIFDYFGASLVSTTLVSDTFTVLESFTGVNDTGNIPHRCRWHQRSMHSPVSMTPAKHVFAGVNDTGEACHRCRWHQWCHASPVSLIPGSKYRQLHRCQWHRRYMSLPVHTIDAPVGPLAVCQWL